jgi:hypothetical protein
MNTTNTSQVILKKRYPATGSDGNTYEVHVYVQTPSVENTDHVAPIEKISSLRTAEGAELRMIGKGHYEILDNGIILTSTAADAI